MSEYQYYDFEARDRVLTADEMATLRQASSRATITRTRFTVDYAYGSFRGDTDGWMERYFDVHCEATSYGVRQLVLAVPTAALSAATLAPWCDEENVTARKADGRVILRFWSARPDLGNWIDGGGLLDGLAPLRDELAAGDLRVLYLGWLMHVVDENYGEDDDVVEPPVPPGLGELTDAQQSFVRFFGLNQDVVAAAAAGSAPRTDRPPAVGAMQDLVVRLPAEEKDALLLRYLEHGEVDGLANLRHRLRAELRGAPADVATPGRTYADLKRLAVAAREKRLRQEAAAEARRRAAQERALAAARTKRAIAAVGREDKLWEKIDALVSQGSGSGYAAAVELILDLREAASRNPGADFEGRLAALRQRCSGRRALLQRLKEAGL